MKTLKELQEAKNTVAFTFGRFNPPTTGHEKLIIALLQRQQSKNAGSLMYVIHLILKTLRKIHFHIQKKSHT